MGHRVCRLGFLKGVVRSLSLAQTRNRMSRSVAAPRSRSSFNVPPTLTMRLKKLLMGCSRTKEKESEGERIESEPEAGLFPHTTVVSSNVTSKYSAF